MEIPICTRSDSSPNQLLLGWGLYGFLSTPNLPLVPKGVSKTKIFPPGASVDNEATNHEADTDFIYKGTPPAELIATLTPLLRKDIYVNNLNADISGDLNKEKESSKGE
jgi:hypothetical protein